MNKANEQMTAMCHVQETSNEARGESESVAEAQDLNNKNILGVLACSAVAMATAGCSNDSECSGRHFDCNDASLFAKNGADFAKEGDVPKTAASTQLSTEIEQSAEGAFDTGVDAVKGASLLIVPWLIIAMISKGKDKSELSEKFYESLLLAGWGALFLTLTDDRAAWLTPVILTAFTSAVAAWTPHKKKIMAASELAALIYMVIAATH